LTLLTQQCEGDDGFKVRPGFVEQFRFEIVRDGHFACGDLFGRGAHEAELAMTQAFRAAFACRAHGRAEDAARHGPPRVHIAPARCGVERGTCGNVGEVFEACLVFDRTTKCAGIAIAGKIRTVFRKPGASAALDLSRERGICGAQFIHSGAKARGVKRVDGKGSVAALRATDAASKERAGTASCLGK
jgi:hypothetical protein